MGRCFTFKASWGKGQSEYALSIHRKLLLHKTSKNSGKKKLNSDHSASKNAARVTFAKLQRM